MASQLGKLEARVVEVLGKGASLSITPARAVAKQVGWEGVSNGFVGEIWRASGSRAWMSARGDRQTVIRAALAFLDEVAASDSSSHGVKP